MAKEKYDPHWWARGTCLIHPKDRNNMDGIVEKEALIVRARGDTDFQNGIKAVEQEQYTAKVKSR